MIKLGQDDLGVVPVVRCEVCARIIRSAKDGLVLFRSPRRNEEVELLHVHKGLCESSAQILADGQLSSHELDLHLKLLMEKLKG